MRITREDAKRYNDVRNAQESNADRLALEMGSLIAVLVEKEVISFGEYLGTLENRHHERLARKFDVKV